MNLSHNNFKSTHCIIKCKSYTYHENSSSNFVIIVCLTLSGFYINIIINKYFHCILSEIPHIMLCYSCVPFPLFFSKWFQHNKQLNIILKKKKKTILPTFLKMIFECLVLNHSLLTSFSSCSSPTEVMIVK